MENYFLNISNLQKLRETYRSLTLKYHPDISGFDSTAIMQEINQQYKMQGDILAKDTEFEKSEIEFNDIFKEKIEVLIIIKNIEIEIIGNWLWVTGDTKPIKELLKGMSFKYAPKKIAWYFKNYVYHKKNGKNLSFEGMRGLFGSVKVSGSGKTNDNIILLNS